VGISKFLNAPFQLLSDPLSIAIDNKINELVDAPTLMISDRYHINRS
jgi:hypothetical protein